MLSVRFEVGVSLLLAPAGADKRGLSSSRKCKNAAGDLQESIHRSSGRSRVLLKALLMWNLFHGNHCDGLLLSTQTLTNTSSFSCPKGTDKLAMFLSIPTWNKTVTSGFMVSGLASRLSSLGSSPGYEHYVVFLDKTLNSHSVSFDSFHPGPGCLKAD